jgi:cyclin C
MGVTNFPSDNTKLAEMEFYLIEELDFHLIVFHPYRSLVQICGRDGGAGVVGVTGEVSKGKNEEMLEMDDTALQMAW